MKSHTSGWICEGFSRKHELRWEAWFPEWMMFLGKSWDVKTLFDFAAERMSCSDF